MLWESILIGLVAILGRLDAIAFGRSNFEQPLITSTLVGLVLGNVAVGLKVGVTLEAIALGFVAVGASGMPDMVLGGVIASSLTILTKTSPETALTIAMPIAILGQMMGVVLQTLFSGLSHKADDYIDKAEFKKARWVPFFTGLTSFVLIYFVLSFSAVYFGSSTVSAIVSSIPKWLTAGLSVIGKVLPAFGFAMLLNMMMDKKNWVFMMAGFFIVAYTKLDIIGLAILAVIVAIILSDIRFHNDDTSGHSTNDDEDDEDELALPDDE